MGGFFLLWEDYRYSIIDRVFCVTPDEFNWKH